MWYSFQNRSTAGQLNSFTLDYNYHDVLKTFKVSKKRHSLGKWVTMCEMEGHKATVRISRQGCTVFKSRSLNAEYEVGSRSPDPAQNSVPWGCMFPEQVLFQVLSKESPDLGEALLGIWVGTTTKGMSNLKCLLTFLKCCKFKILKNALLAKQDICRSCFAAIATFLSLVYN